MIKKSTEHTRNHKTNSKCDHERLCMRAFTIANQKNIDIIAWNRQGYELHETEGLVPVPFANCYICQRHCYVCAFCFSKTVIFNQDPCASKLPRKYQGYHLEMEISGICNLYNYFWNVKLWDRLCGSIVKLLFWPDVKWWYWVILCVLGWGGAFCGTFFFVMAEFRPT